MLTFRAAARWLSPARGLLAIAFLTTIHCAQTRAAPAAVTNAIEILVIQGTVEVARAGQSVWDLASTQAPYRRLNPGDQIRTKIRSRATIRLSDLTIIELGPDAHFQLLRPEAERPACLLLRGLLHLFHRNKPGEYYFRTPTASPVIRGTEFNLEVAENGATTLHLLEGEVSLTNELGQVELKSGEAGRVEPGQPPARMAALDAINVIQWRLYYPAVLHLAELPLSAEEQQALGESIAHYRQGDLLRALAQYPDSREPVSEAEKIYLAALSLSVGNVAEAEALIRAVGAADERLAALANAVRTLIAAVKRQPLPEGGVDPRFASACLAESYHYQAHFDLERALGSARLAVERAPDFAFGWARVAELEFSFGRTRRALDAAERALELAPNHAQAIAVQAFLFAGQNRITPALARFDQAIGIDGALGNAWLGRGLCRIRRGDLPGGAADLLVAAAMEPNRALLRSYLGKAFTDLGDEQRAWHELELAKASDPNDPTAWLYSALLHQQENRVNDAIDDLERSQQLNDNRQLYRSHLLLDQDRAVRQANLAAIYRDAGLFEESTREAANAVSSDYANYSAHLFLANSYAQLGGVSSITLRYETVSFSEYLLSLMLAPVGGSALSPYLSQQEYSRLFQRDGLGLSSRTEYLSSGDWQQNAVQYGTFGNFEYALETYYASQNGQRPNNDSELWTFGATTKFQTGPQDTFFVQVATMEFESGDLRQYHDQAAANPQLRIDESQQPNLFAGYHREWAPGSHTLGLFGWLNDDFRLNNPLALVPSFNWEAGQIYQAVPEQFSIFHAKQRTEFAAYSAELQHIWQTARNTLIVGGRFQYGTADSQLALTNVSADVEQLAFPDVSQSIDTDLNRGVAYVYDYWELCDRFWLVGGLSYDHVSFPENIDSPPFSDQQSEKDQLSPKAGLIWSPIDGVTLRGVYTRSLGGLYYDNSVRLEPTHVAGFNQAFRSLIPESLAGIVAGAEFETAGVDLSWRLPTRTYLGVLLEWLSSDANRTIGIFNVTNFPPAVSPSRTRERLEFEENSLTANINQLIGRDWSFGVRYRVSKAELDRRLVEVLDNLSVDPEDVVIDLIQEDEAVLHQLILSLRFAHPSGFFAEFQPLWYGQQNESVRDEHFWQFNVFAGYRFAKRRAELLVGGLNLSDQDYALNPVNLHQELPRERTLLVSFKFNF